ncbi:hypothetical protein DJ73_13655 [Halorubrum sp. Ea1]|nr:hypothetical protein DJ75_09695 [Halorubrum sp. Eb13]OYR45518.1 hypothetical protein DJ74_16155 [Halorubrum sp. Ea8]OYR45990.1 hypothetical protein DJ81_04100 [Halorubrum sp. Hd13]OYR51324.1 hypothetical protein DJ73_13655 [Halorubrum sp. Ea1]
MNPSRLVALCFFFVSVLLLAQVSVGGELRFTIGTVLQLAGGLFLLLTSLYGLARYEENPIVSEYNPLTYLLISGLLLWAVGLLTQIATV